MVSAAAPLKVMGSEAKGALAPLASAYTLKVKLIQNEHSELIKNKAIPIKF